MEEVSFENAFKYPFNDFKKMLNILWIFVPIVGWLVIMGYSFKIVKEFIKGEFKQLPVLKFREDLELGFALLVKSIPLLVSYVIIIAIIRSLSNSIADLADFFLAIFVLPMLFVNLIDKETIESSFDFDVVKIVFDNLEEYVSVVLKTIALIIIFSIMSIILVGIPAMAFTQDIFIADFYRRKIKKI